MFNVTIQLATVLILKQVWNNITEIGIPSILIWWRRRKNVASTEENIYAAWEKDFDLQPLPKLPLFPEYFEMIIQFGFVTMFVAAFPVAPLLALLNNIVEIRLDAHKFVKEYRRVLPKRVADIGTWYTLLEMITKIAVITNGLLIAFTTDLIDRLVYKYSPGVPLIKYTDFVLSTFDCNDWPDPSLCWNDSSYIRYCSYRAYYTGPASLQQDSEPYIKSEMWWIVMVIKLAFVLIFEHVIFSFQALIEYMAPGVPEEVNLHVQRNRHLSKVGARQLEQQREQKRQMKELKKKGESMEDAGMGKNEKPSILLTSPMGIPTPSSKANSVAFGGSAGSMETGSMPETSSVGSEGTPKWRKFLGRKNKEQKE